MSARPSSSACIVSTRPFCAANINGVLFSSVAMHRLRGEPSQRTFDGRLPPKGLVRRLADENVQAPRHSQAKGEPLCSCMKRPRPEAIALVSHL